MQGETPEERARAKEQPETAAGEDQKELTTPAMLFCPRCDSALLNRRCKLLCSRCGYYMSCADYY